MRQFRIALGIILVIISIALLIWGFLPARREIRTQPISPTELQLPTPTSLHFGFCFDTPYRAVSTAAQYRQIQPLF